MSYLQLKSDQKSALIKGFPSPNSHGEAEHWLPVCNQNSKFQNSK